MSWQLLVFSGSIATNTEVDPELWIHLFAARFRAIMDEDSSGTKSQIKRKLYLNE